MKLSLYTCVKDGLRLDFHLEAMLRHHLPFADEIVVNEGHSRDGTYERIAAIDDPRIVIVRSRWKASESLLPFKDAARRRCTGDWCIHLDCDELLPEWEWEPIRRHLAETDREIVPLRYTNFYGNYRVYHAEPRKVRWPLYKYTIHRNRPDVEFWGDGSSVRVRGRPPERFDASRPSFECHHFGMVRHPARLREKWRTQARRDGKRGVFPLPRFLFSLAPHDWFDAMFLDGLKIYDGPLLQAVRDDPAEFVRDDFRLYEYLRSRTPAAG
jgi:glycosyltransferase involved in cell wall biosynthesis